MKKSMCILAVLLLVSPLHGQTADTTSLTTVGQTVPDFTVTTLDGKTLAMSRLRGTVVLINFFATWCGPCMTEMPRVEKEIWQALNHEKFLVLAVGRQHSAEELVKFNQKKNFTFPIAPDPQREVYGRFAKQYIPRNYVIDRNGTIVYQSMGYSPEEFSTMVALIKEKLKQPSRP